MAELRNDYQFFLDNKKELVEKYGGMYLVISNGKVDKTRPLQMKTMLIIMA